MKAWRAQCVPNYPLSFRKRGMQTELGKKIHGRLFEFPHLQVVLATPYMPYPHRRFCWGSWSNGETYKAWHLRSPSIWVWEVIYRSSHSSRLFWASRGKKDSHLSQKMTQPDYQEARSGPGRGNLPIPQIIMAVSKVRTHVCGSGWSAWWFNVHWPSRILSYFCEASRGVFAISLSVCLHACLCVFSTHPPAWPVHFLRTQKQN